MRPRAALIHQSRSNGAIIGSLLYLLLDLLIGVYIMLFQSIHIHPQGLMLAYLQLLLLRFREQIPYALIIDFKHTNFDLEGPRPILITLDLLEDRIANYRDESLVGPIPDHRVGFT